MPSTYITNYWKAVEPRCNGHETYSVSMAMMWLGRVSFIPPERQKRAEILFNTYSVIVKEVLAGKTYSIPEAEHTSYFTDYILAGHDFSRYTPNRRTHCIEKHFNGSVELVKNIRDIGLRRPIDFICEEDGKLYMWKGLKRFTIMAVMGVTTLPILIHHRECATK